MIATPNSVIDALLEDEEDDFDADLAKEIGAEDTVTDRLLLLGFKKDGTTWFAQLPGGASAISVTLLSPNWYSVRDYRWAEENNEWVEVCETEMDDEHVLINLNWFENNPLREGQEDEDDFTDFKDITSEKDRYGEIHQLIDQGILEVEASVRRANSHYVHERTTDCSFNWQWNWERPRNEDEQSEQEITEKRLEPDLDALGADIQGRLYGWNHKIYQELVAAYDDSVSEAVVAENIRANEYDFDEDGRRDDDGGFQYDQLTPEAKEKAREWWINGENNWGDNSYADCVVAEWKWLLQNKGFNGVEIAWSGFWRQGDGASFTATSIDILKYLTGPDPLEVPGADREMIDESAEDDDSMDLDPKDVYATTPRDKRPIMDIKTKADYEEYKTRFKEFMERQGITNLSTVSDEEGKIERYFSWRPCDCCQRGLAGNRVEASGYNPATKQAQEYEICEDCEYYAAYGQLDDMTMMDMKDVEESTKNPVQENEEDDFDNFKDIEPEPKPQPAPSTFFVSSSHGMLTAQINDGKVIEVHLYPPEDAEGRTLNNIDRFDVEEWRRYYPGEKIEPDASMDILDFGLWNKNGTYEQPEMEWRREMAADRNDPGWQPEN
jgi:hypothetical protein